MPIVSFSEQDLLRGRIITPGWYRVKIDTVGEQPAKASEKGPSTNYPVEGVIKFNGDTGSTEFSNTPLSWNFNSKAMGFSIGFLEALGVKVAPNVRFDLKSAEGLEIDVFVENGEYQGRIVNRVNHKYRAIRPEVTAVA